MHQKIAIAGMAGIFPDAAGVNEFATALRAGLGSVRPVDNESLWRRCADTSAEYGPMALLDDISLFDHELFGVSPREAAQMDPHQRILLQLVRRALDDACVPDGDLTELRTSVIATSPRPEYYRMLRDLDSLAVLGVAPAGTAGRIAFVFGCEGPTFNIETACNSALVATSRAMQLLRAGECDLAVVASLSLKILPEPKDVSGRFRGIMSGDGQCYAFDARAEGTSDGEGGAAFIMARLDDAVKRGYNVRATLLGSAINHNGSRASNFSAPSVAAQTSLLVDAWRDAGLDPNTLAYVETHGAGTRIGDAVEALALGEAMRRSGRVANPLVIGSVKTNIGHLDHAAAAAGLVKAVLSLEEGWIYPSLNFDTPNPQIDFAKENLAVARHGQPWPATRGPRRAGVSSFSLAGSNAHIVLEQAPPRRDNDGPASGEAHLLCISERNPERLRRRLNLLADHIADHAPSFDDLVFTLNRGRSSHAVRYPIVATSSDEVHRLLTIGCRDFEEADHHRAFRGPRMAFLAPTTAAAAGLVEALRDRFPAFDRAVARCEDVIGERAVGTGAVAQLVTMYALHALLSDLGFRLAFGFGAGIGNLLLEHVASNLPLEKMLDGADATPDIALDRRAVETAVAQAVADGPVIFLNLGIDDDLVRTVADCSPEGAALVGLGGDLVPSAVLAAIGQAWREGATLDWAKLDPLGRGQAVSIEDTVIVDVRAWPRGPGESLPWQSLWLPDARAVERPPACDPSIAAREIIPPAPGKLDIKADQLQSTIQAVWADLLMLLVVAPNDNYFALGGNSILAMEMVDRLERTIGLRIPLIDLYDHPSPATLALRIAATADEMAANHATEAPLRRADSSKRLPLSLNQERLWFLHGLDPGSAAYNLPTEVLVHGPLDAAQLQEAVSRFVARHQELRARYFEDTDGPYAILQPAGDVEVPLIDLSDHGPMAMESARDVVWREATRPFSMGGEPLYRFALIRLADDQHIIFTNVHHLVDDGWSPAIFMREIGALYRGEAEGGPSLPELEYQYCDWVLWQQDYLKSTALDDGLAYWSNRLAGTPPLELPADQPRASTGSSLGGHARFVIPGDQLERLRALARDRSTTLFTVMLSLYMIALNRFTGQTDLAVGTPTSGRSRPEFRNVVGFFNNTIVFRETLDLDESVNAFVGRAHRTVAQALQHQDTPFDLVVKALRSPRDLSRNPVFQAFYVHQLIPHTVSPSDTFKVRGPLEAFEQAEVAGSTPGTAKFDLSLLLLETPDADRLPCMIEYRADILTRGRAEAFVEVFQAIIAAASAAPEQPVGTLCGLSGAQWATLEALAGPETPNAAPRSVLQRFEEAARSAPDRDALVTDCGETHSYGALDAAANAWASIFAQRRMKPGDIVAIHLLDRVRVVEAILGAWKIGAVFLPLDPDYPARRLQDMLDQSAARVLVSDQPQLLDAGGLTVVGPKDFPEAVPPRPFGPVTLQAGHPAYLLFTSGSTGKPKGVLVSHDNLAWLVEGSAIRFGFGPETRMSCIAPFSFDVGLGELFIPLGIGGTCVLLGSTARRDPAAVGAALERWNVNAMSGTPTLFASLLDCGWEGSPGITAISIGEPLPRTLAARLLERVGELRNAYGPTEATVWVSDLVCTTEYMAGLERPFVPLGRSFPGTRLYVVDAALQPVAPGVRGELIIAGRQVGLGYLGAAELTTERFVEAPFLDGELVYRTGDLVHFDEAGQLHFDGRADRQVKIRGHRVELGEIEEVLRGAPTIDDIVVELDRQHMRGERLVAFVKPASLGAGWEEQARRRAEQLLPAVMRPSAWIEVDSFALTPTGKTDRQGLIQRLDEAFGSPPATQADRRTPTAAPETAEWLMDLASELLRRTINEDENLFELGGTSLEVARLAAAIRDRRGVSLSLVSMIQAPTLGDIARLIEVKSLHAEGSVLSTMREGGAAAPLFFVHPAGGMNFCYEGLCRRLPLDVPVHALWAVGLFEGRQPDTTVEAMAGRYVDAILGVSPAGPIRLAGWSTGGTIAFEVAQQLSGRGRRPDLVAMIDAPVNPATADDPETLSELFLRALVEQFGPAAVGLTADQGAADEEARVRALFAQAQRLNLVPGAYTDDDGVRFATVLAATDRALALYRPQPYDGPVDLFLADPDNNSASGDAGPVLQAWQPLLRRPPNIYQLPGDHMSLLAGSNAEILAHHLSGRLIALGSTAYRPVA